MPWTMHAPYDVHEMALFPLQIANLDEEAADFAIHLVGDVQDHKSHCEQLDYQDTNDARPGINYVYHSRCVINSMKSKLHCTVAHKNPLPR